MLLELDRIRELRNEDISKNIGDLCNIKEKSKDTIPKIKYVLENHPLEFRQAILDMEDESKKAAISLYLCARARGNDSKRKRFDCSEHEISVPDKIQIKVKGFKTTRQNTSMGSRLGYTITKGSPPEISTTIKLKKGPSLSDEEFEKFKLNQENGVNNFFNCQAGAIKNYKDQNGETINCPEYDPAKAKFKINFVEDGDYQVGFNVHKCFNGDATKQLCSGEVKQASMNSCYEKMKSRQIGLKLTDLFPDRQEIKIGKQRAQSYYNKYALDCIEEAKDLPQCQGKNGCELQTCTAVACAVVPQEEGACFQKDVIDMVCEKRLRSPEELEENPSPLDQLPESPPIDSPRWNRANSNNLTAASSPRVLYHELSHRMGVDDEYYDDESFPIPNFGEPESLMRSGTKLFPRHFETMLKPLHCLDDKAVFFFD